MVRGAIHATDSFCVFCVFCGSIFLMAGNAQRPSGGIALALFRRKTAKERAVLPAPEGARPLRRGSLERRSLAIPEPFGRVSETDFAVMVFPELGNKPPIPRDIEDWAVKRGLPKDLACR